MSNNIPLYKKYNCEYPGCKFATADRSRIDRHHIIPKSMPGTTNQARNLMWCCPDHHRAIYVPGVKSGHHSSLQKDSIVVIGRLNSTQGKALEFRKCSDDKVYYYFYRDGETWEK